MGRSFYKIPKERIKPFYDGLVCVATDHGTALVKPSFNKIQPVVEGAYDRKCWIVYDQQGFWYELEMGDGC